MSRNKIYFSKINLLVFSDKYFLASNAEIIVLPCAKTEKHARKIKLCSHCLSLYVLKSWNYKRTLLPVPTVFILRSLKYYQLRMKRCKRYFVLAFFSTNLNIEIRITNYFIFQSKCFTWKKCFLLGTQYRSDSCTEETSSDTGSSCWRPWRHFDS